MERLTGQDLSSLWPEDFGWPQDIGALAILDGSTLLDPEGRLRIEVLHDQLARRLHSVPRFRQVLYRPCWGLGRPLWVDAPHFDLADHVRVFPLAPPADQPQLLHACEQLRRRRLDPSRPLWELWFLPGLPEGRLGMLLRLHHVIADGVAGVAIAGVLLDLAAATSPPPARPWTPAPCPTTRDLLVDNLRRRGKVTSSALARLGHPLGVLRQARRAWPVTRELFAEQPAPRTSLNRPIGPDRRLALVRSHLALAKTVAHAHDAKVNDVVLAAVAGGLRALLQSRGERVEGLVLRAAVPVSLHRGGGAGAQGNLDAAMAVPLPVGEPDPVRRLRQIAAETARRKQKPRPQMFSGVLASSLIQRAALHMIDCQRSVNVYVANVPGPPVPLYVAGTPLLEVFPLVPIAGNVTLGVGGAVLRWAAQPHRRG